ncbi:MAG TPA: TIM-barrel domain-containing protein [Steroidobacteraceae bacterium]|nr:TIM-barrel domain-containing protein [Steroidobacteraceae bacterium]
MRHTSSALLFCILASVVVEAAAATSAYIETNSGIVVAPQSGPAKRVRLEVIADRIIHVTSAPSADLENLPASLMTIAKPEAKKSFAVKQRDGSVTLATGSIQATVSLQDGAVRFADAKGNVRLAETSHRVLTPVQIDGQTFYSIEQQFNANTQEAFYGLGQHQNAQMNYNGEDVLLAQHNMDVAIPFVVSDRNYGVLWDNNSITRFGNPRPYGLVSRDLKVYDATGKAGGFTATYSVAGIQKVQRVEADINYQYIKDLAHRPQEVLGETTPNNAPRRNDIKDLSVVWEGKLESDKAGLHRFQLYAGSYFKLFVDGKLIFDKWRQNWNPWYHNFDVPMQAGKPIAVRIEWIPDNSHIALLHNDPLSEADRHSLMLSSEAAHAIDYYYIAGSDLDEVIAGYRSLTGKAVMLPRWAYGFWQSRQRYTTQGELLDAVKEYRKRNLPLDNIVMDWFYWREDQWGSHQFDPERFPDPKAMIGQIHDLNAHFMISVWPKFYPNTKNFKELDAKGFIYKRNIEKGTKDWVGEGHLSSFYDPYSAEARQIYWRQIDENLNRLGVDAWWLDASEPDVHSNLDPEEIKKRIGPTAIGPSAAYFNSYPLVHSAGVYQGDRAADPDKRVFILTRSSFAGQQRTAAATWSGDVASRWDDLRNQVSAGVNFSMSGLPNWTFDIGGFALESRYMKPSAADLDEWRELNLRWFQFGAFAPLFRSHGEFPYREIYNLAPEGSEVYRSLVSYDELRYRLLPYIYTLAADTHHRDEIIMRGLVMDFADPKVRNIDDEYLFGRAFLISPVHEYKARSRKVYLPQGAAWYDFYSGERTEGGRSVDAAAPLARMPIYVKAGSIVPTGPAIQYSSQSLNAPLTINVYTGANGEFDLYEDDGLSYGYERGEYSRIPLRYDEATKTLTIDDRKGSFPGMATSRTIHVRWITPGKSATNFDAPADATVTYSGKALRISGK